MSRPPSENLSADSILTISLEICIGSGDYQTFGFGGDGKTLIRAGEMQSRETGSFKGERGSELKAIGGSQGVGAEKAQGEFTNLRSWTHLVPTTGESGETITRLAG